MKEFDLQYLKDCGNLYEKLMNPEYPINVLRVYGYESRAVDLLFESTSGRTIREEEQFCVLLKDIKKSLPQGWSDNKIVVEISLGNNSWDWHVFIGYWDDKISIGFGVCPNRWQPKAIYDNFGCIKPIKIR